MNFIKMHEKNLETSHDLSGFQHHHEAQFPKGWKQLDTQSQKKIEVIIGYLNSRRMKEITIKIDGSKIKKGYAVEKDRSFDSNARLSDYLKVDTKITLSNTTGRIFGRKEIIF